MYSLFLNSLVFLRQKLRPLCRAIIWRELAEARMEGNSSLFGGNDPRFPAPVPRMLTA